MHTLQLQKCYHKYYEQHKKIDEYGVKEIKESINDTTYLQEYKNVTHPNKIMITQILVSKTCGKQYQDMPNRAIKLTEERTAHDGVFINQNSLPSP